MPIWPFVAAAFLTATDTGERPLIVMVPMMAFVFVAVFIYPAALLPFVGYFIGLYLVGFFFYILVTWPIMNALGLDPLAGPLAFAAVILLALNLDWTEIRAGSMTPSERAVQAERDERSLEAAKRNALIEGYRNSGAKDPEALAEAALAAGRPRAARAIPKVAAPTETPRENPPAPGRRAATMTTAELAAAIGKERRRLGEADWRVDLDRGRILSTWEPGNSTSWRTLRRLEPTLEHLRRIAAGDGEAVRLAWRAATQADTREGVGPVAKGGSR